MLSPAWPARVRRSRRWRRQRSTSTTWECTVPARSAGRAPGRRRCRAIQPVTDFNTDADTSRLARSGTAGSRGRGDWLWRDDLRSESPRPLPESQLSPATTPLSPSVLVRKPHYLVSLCRSVHVVHLSIGELLSPGHHDVPGESGTDIPVSAVAG